MHQKFVHDSIIGMILDIKLTCKCNTYYCGKYSNALHKTFMMVQKQGSPFQIFLQTNKKFKLQNLKWFQHFTLLPIKCENSNWSTYSQHLFLLLVGVYWYLILHFFLTAIFQITVIISIFSSIYWLFLQISLWSVQILAHF